MTLREQEAFHLKYSHVAIVLDTSKGSGEEIAHFSNSELKIKLRVFTPEEYKDSPSFPGALREGLSQDFYSQEEFDKCSLVERVVARVRVVALAQLTNIQA